MRFEKNPKIYCLELVCIVFKIHIKGIILIEFYNFVIKIKLNSSIRFLKLAM